MKRFINSIFLKLLKPLALLFFLITLIINVNAQSLTDNKISTPSVSYGVNTVNPAEITGNVVSLVNAELNVTPNYQWQKSASAKFLSPVNITGATSQSYDPPAITTTTYYRRVTTFNYDSKVYTSISNTVRITVNSATTAPATITPNSQSN